MPQPLNFYPSHLQVALFLSTIDLTKKPDLAIAIRDASSELIDGDPIMLPIPDNVPPDFPQLVANSKNELWNCQVSLSRMDFHFHQKFAYIQNASLKEVAKQHIALASDVWKVVREKFQASAHRIGFVVKQVSLESDASSLLQSAFLRTTNFDSAEKIQIHALHKLNLDTYQVNRWVRFRTINAPEELESDYMLQAEIDINTLPSDKLNLSASQINDFSNKALAMAQYTMQQFWEGVE